LITLTVSSSELSTKTGVVIPEAAGGAAVWAAAGKLVRAARAHSQAAAKRAGTFTKTVFLGATG